MGSMGNITIVNILASFVLMCVYLIPYYVGYYNKKRHENMIFWVNLLVGWTVVGWLAVLIWAFAKDRDALESKDISNK